MNNPFLPRAVYAFLFFLIGLVCSLGLFVTLMDNDAAHHAAIALHMHLTGDYASLVDQGTDYLDKPHLHFWLAAASYKVFGANNFAYKLPSFFIAILGVYSTYRLGRTLYSNETGKLAALIMATAFGFLLSVSDVRMDAILTSCIAFSSWQLVVLIRDGRWKHVAGSALGLALGFSTKGHIAVFVPAVIAFFYLLEKKEFKKILSLKWLALLVLFFLLISPVLYCYYLQFNLHPEKTVRGRDHINGVRFILFDQVFDRMAGKMEKETNQDPFFFFHAFLSAFLPWSILAFMTIAIRLKNLRDHTWERATTAVFIVVMVFVSLSQYQLPHYLNILFPSTAVLVSAFLFNHRFSGKWRQVILVIQSVVVFIILLAAAILNAWAFPVQKTFVIVGVILLLAVVFYFIKSRQYDALQKAVAVPAAAMIFLFFLLNTNFYPQLLQYQAGKYLALSARGITKTNDIYYWENTYSSSFSFYSRSFRIPFHDSVLNKNSKIWLLYDERDEPVIKSRYNLSENRWAADDYEITKLTLAFLDPKKRKGQCTRLVLGEIYRK